MSRLEQYAVGHCMNPRVTCVPRGMVQAPITGRERHPRFVPVTSPAPNEGKGYCPKEIACND